jgi:hypothetical protein
VKRLLALLLAFGAAPTAVAETFYTSAPSFTGPHPAVVRVVVPERGGTSYGSGALVAVNESSGLVLTNWHVVRDAAGAIVVYFPNGFHSGAYLLRTDRDWDLAALAIRRPSVQPLVLSHQAPRPGEELTIAGYGSGSYRAVTGRLTQYVSPGGNQPFEMIELSAPARNGDSGGPILNSRGELAGTLFGSAFGRTTGSYCGRLRWFVDNVEGDFRRISSQAMLAQQARRDAPLTAAIHHAPSAASKSAQSANAMGLPNPGAGESSSPWQPPRAPSAVATAGHSTLPAASKPAASALDEAGFQVLAPVVAASSPRLTASIPAAAALPKPEMAPSPLPVTPPAGSGRVRSVLALIGALALLYQAVRFLGWVIG